MKLDYQYRLDGSFHPKSKVWIYQANRMLLRSEALKAEEILREFTANWKSHGDPVKGAAYLFFDQFIILMADETQTGVGGCSTDSSVRVIKEMEGQLGLSFFDRTSLAFVIGDKVEIIPLAELELAIQQGSLKSDSLYFNNLVQTKEELESNWIIPVKQSWLGNKFSVAI